MVRDERDLTCLAAQYSKGDGCAHCLHLTFASHFPKKAQPLSQNRIWNFSLSVIRPLAGDDDPWRDSGRWRKSSCLSGSKQIVNTNSSYNLDVRVLSTETYIRFYLFLGQCSVLIWNLQNWNIEFLQSYVYTVTSALPTIYSTSMRECTLLRTWIVSLRVEFGLAYRPWLDSNF